MAVTYLRNLLVLLFAFSAAAQDFGFKGSDDGDWVIIGNCEAQYINCLYNDQYGTDNGDLVALCLPCGCSNYSEILSTCCPSLPNFNTTACESLSSAAAAVTQTPVTITASYGTYGPAACNLLSGVWDICQTSTTSFFQLPPASQSQCLCAGLTDSNGQVTDNEYYTVAASCYDYLAAVTPGSVASALSSANVDMCRVGSAFGSGVTATSITQVGPTKTSNPSPSPTVSSAPQKTNDVGRMGSLVGPVNMFLLALVNVLPYL